MHHCFPFAFLPSRAELKAKATSKFGMGGGEEEKNVDCKEDTLHTPASQPLGTPSAMEASGALVLASPLLLSSCPPPFCALTVSLSLCWRGGGERRDLFPRIDRRGWKRSLRGALQGKGWKEDLEEGIHCLQFTSLKASLCQLPMGRELLLMPIVFCTSEKCTNIFCTSKNFSPEKERKYI